MTDILKLKAVVSNKITEGDPVKVMERRILEDIEDYSGWTFLAGTETQAYLNNPKNSTVLPLESLQILDPKVKNYLKAPNGTIVEFDETNTPHVTHT